MRFRTREEAGRLLAARLKSRIWDQPLVLALPRGGVPVAVPVAETLETPLECFVVRKIGAPGRRELGLGALAETGAVVLDPDLVAWTRTSQREIDRIVAEEKAELERRVALYRDARLLPDLWGRQVIVIDDGIATGGTARAVGQALRQQGPSQLVLAVPVAAASALPSLRGVFDEVISLMAPVDLSSVGEWYEDFRQVSDDEVVALLSQYGEPLAPADEEVLIALPKVTLTGTLAVPEGAQGLVLFAHGSGSGRFSPRNNAVARALRREGFATLLVDLLTDVESQAERQGQMRRFDVGLLAKRLAGVIDWLGLRADLKPLPVGLYGSSTGAAAALEVAAFRPRRVFAVVCRGGRVDLTSPDAVAKVMAPVLMVVGGADQVVLELNRQVKPQLPGQVQLVQVPGAGHLFEEPGALEQVTRLTVRWFADQIAGAQPAAVQ